MSSPEPNTATMHRVVIDLKVTPDHRDNAFSEWIAALANIKGQHVYAYVHLLRLTWEAAREVYEPKEDPRV